jgi:hypothetical protein
MAPILPTISPRPTNPIGHLTRSRGSRPFSGYRDIGRHTFAAPRPVYASYSLSQIYVEILWKTIVIWSYNNFREIMQITFETCKRLRAYMPFGARQSRHVKSARLMRAFKRPFKCVRRARHVKCVRLTTPEYAHAPICAFKHANILACNYIPMQAYCRLSGGAWAKLPPTQ